MTKSGELKPVANHPAASMNLICEVSENGCLVRVAIWISDNGAYVSAKYREDIFAAFRKLMPTGETSGLGLGLAMAKRIVKRHGGHLRCEGTSDEKCAFVFDLQMAFERMS
jgi:light-regulated signal transduction histidine kinase (bacteriophytochrome)